MPDQGHFFVPHNGLYCFSVKIHQTGQQHFIVYLMSKKSHEAKQRYQIIMDDDIPHSASCVLYLSAGEEVFLKISHSNGPIKLINTFTFSGWSVGYE